jgi:tetratricopeptide (TPR) repeat protein
MRRRSMRRLSVATLLLAMELRASGTAAREQKEEQSEEEVDRLALSARLIADGHHDRALAVMNDIPKDQKELDRAKYHLLYATIYLHKQLWKDARSSLLASIKAGQENPSVQLMLAQACFQLEDYRGAIAALDRVPQLADANPGTFTMRAEAHWKQKQPREALAALDRGIAKFPDFPKLAQMKIGYLLELTLYQEVVQVGERYLARPNVQPADYVSIAEGFRRAKQLHDARLVMEQAHLRFPGDRDALLQLANIYSDLAKPLSAAMLYETASLSDPKYSFEAAELYKEADRLARALSLNERTLDPQKKLKQRMSILLEMERYELVAGMEASLSRSGLLKDENLRYALAYGYFKIGDFDNAEQHLKLLSGSSAFEKATALRKAMATCREAGWSCF